MRGRTNSVCNYCERIFSHVLSKSPKYCSFICKVEAQKKSIKHVCSVCGKEYKVFEKYNDGNSSKFCSQRCRSSQKIEKYCKNCNVIFKVKPSQSTQEFCNSKCRKLYNKKNSKRKCAFCNKVFYVSSPSVVTKYCCKECRLLSKRKRSICKHCGKEFHHVPSENRKYCSLSCSNSALHKVDVLVKNTIERIKKGECVSKTELLLKDDLLKFEFVPQYITKFGSVDYVHVDKKIAVFVDGVFWHGHKKCHWKSTSFKDIIEKTRCKDKWQNVNMPKEGWTVLRYWDDYVRQHTDECVADILSYLNNTK